MYNFYKFLSDKNVLNQALIDATFFTHYPNVSNGTIVLFDMAAGAGYLISIWPTQENRPICSRNIFMRKGLFIKYARFFNYHT